VEKSETPSPLVKTQAAIARRRRALKISQRLPALVDITGVRVCWLAGSESGKFTGTQGCQNIAA
jgi:hypothetical protein